MDDQVVGAPSLLDVNSLRVDESLEDDLEEEAVELECELDLCARYGVRDREGLDCLRAAVVEDSGVLHSLARIAVCTRELTSIPVSRYRIKSTFVASNWNRSDLNIALL